jgi:hypothetical protein
MTTKIDSTVDWTQREWDHFAEWIHSVLKETTVKITFTKKDGTERVMNCTLNATVLPLVETHQQKREQEKPKDYIAVYDTEAKGWRSFVIKSVKAFEFTLE